MNERIGAIINGLYRSIETRTHVRPGALRLSVLDYCTGKRVTAIVTLSCFLFSSVFVQSAQGLVESARGVKEFKLLMGEVVLPPSVGRITEWKDFGSRRVVVNVQDLHCHAEVQRNISRTLRLLDGKYGLKKVYVEGASGTIDTSWLGGMKDEVLKKEVVEALVDGGKLTGSEHYSIVSGRPEVLEGIEEERLYEANLLRLERILENRGRYEKELGAMRGELEVMKGRYFNGRNRRFEKLEEKYRRGELEAGKYYKLLKKYAGNINENRYDGTNITGIDIESYGNICGYVELLERGKKLKYKSIARQLQEFVLLLKQKLPYSAYNYLLTKTEHFQKLDELYVYLLKIAREYRLDMRGSYPQLNEFFGYLEQGRKVNPLELVKEEKKLVEEIRMGLSEDEAELEVSFLCDFFGYFEDYVHSRLSAADYEYFKGRIEEFKLLWRKYGEGEWQKRLAGDFGLMNEYYEANVERNDSFIKAIAGSSEGKAAGAGKGGNGEDAALGMLDGAGEVVAVVAGGFHTEGLKGLLEERGISYVTITPNVTQDTKRSDVVYEELAKQQARVLEAALAPMLASMLVKLAVQEGRSPEQVKAVAAVLDYVLEAAVRGQKEENIERRVRKLLGDESVKKILGSVTEVRIIEGDGKKPWRFVCRVGGQTLVYEYRAGEGVRLAGTDEAGKVAPETAKAGAAKEIVVPAVTALEAVAVFTLWAGASPLLLMNGGTLKALTALRGEGNGEPALGWQKRLLIEHARRQELLKKNPAALLAIPGMREILVALGINAGNDNAAALTEAQRWIMNSTGATGVYAVDLRAENFSSPYNYGGQSRLADAVDKGKVIVITPGVQEEGAAGLSKIYRELKQLSWLLNVSFWRLFSNESEGSGTDLWFPVFELLKNAFVWGNKLDRSMPVYLYVDLKKHEVLVYNFVNDEKTIDPEELKAADFAGLHGDGKAIAILQGEIVHPNGTRVKTAYAKKDRITVSAQPRVDLFEAKVSFDVAKNVRDMKADSAGEGKALAVGGRLVKERLGREAYGRYVTKLAPVWETVAFPLAGVTGIPLVTALTGGDVTNAVLGGLAWATAGFSFAHTIGEWIHRAKDSGGLKGALNRKDLAKDAKDFFLRLSLSLPLTLPFLLPVALAFVFVAGTPFITPAVAGIASLAAFILSPGVIRLHAQYNEAILAGQLPRWLHLVPQPLRNYAAGNQALLSVVRREGAQAAVPENEEGNLKANGYRDAAQDFSGVDLEHFVHAQNILAEKLLTKEQLQELLRRLGVLKAGEPLQEERTDSYYREIYDRLAEGNCTPETLDIINGETYEDPRLAIEILGQNPNPRAQGVCEAIANSLDALGFTIGQFGKGVKQIIDWLEPNGQDRIDVFTKSDGLPPYRLTILKSVQGQYYIEIKKIAADTFVNESAGRVLERGTIVKVTTQKRIPRHSATGANSQESIDQGIRKRFPYVTYADIYTTAGKKKRNKVNGFDRKITVAGERGEQGNRRGMVDVILNEHRIQVVDNGSGMNPVALSRMFVPKQGSKTPPPLGSEAAERELGNVKVVQDASLPHRVSFARNSEVVVAVDIPRDIPDEATVQGGLMVELGSLLEVPESRDSVIIPTQLKPGEISNFQRGIMFAVRSILRNDALSPADRIKYVNTIMAGLDGLVQGNDNYAYTMRSIRALAQHELRDAIETVREDGYVLLPHDRQFEKLAVPEGKKPLYLHEKLFDWQGAASMQDIWGDRAAVIPGITLGGDKRLPLVVAPFAADALRIVRSFDPFASFDRRNQPFIKTDRFIALPYELGARLRDLALQRGAGGLGAKEEKEFASLVQQVNNLTAEEVVTSYEVAKPRENVRLQEAGDLSDVRSRAVDAKAVRSFLHRPPVSDDQGVPPDTNMKYVRLSNGAVVEIGTGRTVLENAESMEPVINDYYIIKEKYLPLRLFKIDETTAKPVMISPELSPDKRYAYTDAENMRAVRNLETGEMHFLDNEFLTAPGNASSNQRYHDLAFSKDGKYLAYLVTDGSKGSTLHAVDLAWKKVIRLDIPWMQDIEYALNPYANVVHVRSESGGMALVDLRSGETIVSGAQHLYTDSSGTCTAIIKNGEMSAYVHATGELISADSFNRKDNAYRMESIERVITGRYTDGRKTECLVEMVGSNGQVYYYDLVNEGYVPADTMEFAYQEEFSYAGDLTFMNAEQDVRCIPDPLQRLAAPGWIYRHPEFDLLIDNRRRDRPVAIEPVRWSAMPFRGQLVKYVNRGDGPVVHYRTRGHLYQAFYMDGEMATTRPGRGVIDSVPFTCVVQILESGYQLLDFSKPQHSSHIPVPLRYSAIVFDGKYFVFADPANGDVAYLDPRNPGEPVLVPMNGNNLPAGFVDRRPADAPRRYVIVASGNSEYALFDTVTGRTGEQHYQHIRRLDEDTFVAYDSIEDIDFIQENRVIDPQAIPELLRRYSEGLKAAAGGDASAPMETQNKEYSLRRSGNTVTVSDNPREHVPEATIALDGALEGFVPTDVDGEYFVFSNPRTKEMLYLNPLQFLTATANIKPLSRGSRSAGSRKTDESPAMRAKESDKRRRILSLWNERIIGSEGKIRHGFIARVQEAYNPFFDLVPREFSRDMEAAILPLVGNLYEEQEGEIRKRFQGALEGKELTFDVMPFDAFAKKVDQVMSRLPGYVEILKARLSQQDYDVQKKTYRNLFAGLFALCGEPGMDIGGIDGKCFEALAGGWAIKSREQFDAAAAVDDFIQELRRTSGDNELLAQKIVGFLSAFVSAAGNREQAIATVEKQMRRVLEAKPGVRDRFLKELCDSFQGVDPAMIDEYLADPATARHLGRARAFIVFFTNDVEPLRRKERAVPGGISVELPPEGIGISQIVNLEKQRSKNPGEPDDAVMSVEYLEERIADHLQGKAGLPPLSEKLEAEIRRNAEVQRESGAYAAEIAQNSRDAESSSLEVEYYLQHNGGAEEYVEEARDFGTGALKEIALLIPKSMKASGGQREATGYFGTGKYTIFEGVDRVEIITKKADGKGYMFSFRVLKNDTGKITAITLAGIRQVHDAGVAQGVTVRRIKNAENTIPELDQMLAQRAWKTFAGLSQTKDFAIHVVDYAGKRRGLDVVHEVVSQSPFNAARPGKPEKTGYGPISIISTEDMPLQVVDRAGLRVCDLSAKEEFLSLVPAQLRKHIPELGINLQIPLPLIRGRSSFEHEDIFLNELRKRVAIEFYKAIACKTLTQNNPQFVFEGFPMDWETNDDYWHSIRLDRDKELLQLAENINSGRYDRIRYRDLERIHEVTADPAASPEKKQATVARLIVLLKVAVDHKDPLRRESLLERRLAVQERINAQVAERQRRSLGHFQVEPVDLSGIPYIERKLQQANTITTAREQMRYPERYIVPEAEYTAADWELYSLAKDIAKNFGLSNIEIVGDRYDDRGRPVEPIAFAGAFKGNVFYLNRKIALEIGRVNPVKGFIDEASDTILHELSHYVENLRSLGKSSLGNGEIYVADAAFTHQAVGTFADIMKYLAGVSLYHHTPAPDAPANVLAVQGIAASVVYGFTALIAAAVLGWLGVGEFHANLSVAGTLAAFLSGRAAVAGIAEWLIHGRLLRGGPRQAGVVNLKPEGSLGFNLKIPSAFTVPRKLLALAGLPVAALVLVSSLLHEAIHKILLVRSGARSQLWRSEALVYGIESAILALVITVGGAGGIMLPAAAVLLLSAGVLAKRPGRTVRVAATSGATAFSNYLGHRVDARVAKAIISRDPGLHKEGVKLEIRDGEAVLSVHEAFLTRLKNRAPPGRSQSRILSSLVDYKIYEYLAFYWPDSPAGVSFSLYLMTEKGIFSRDDKNADFAEYVAWLSRRNSLKSSHERALAGCLDAADCSRAYATETGKPENVRERRRATGARNAAAQRMRKLASAAVLAAMIGVGSLWGTGNDSSDPRQVPAPVSQTQVQQAPLEEKTPSAQNDRDVPVSNRSGPVDRSVAAGDFNVIESVKLYPNFNMRAELQRGHFADVVTKEVQRLVLYDSNNRIQEIYYIDENKALLANQLTGYYRGCPGQTWGDGTLTQYNFDMQAGCVATDPAAIPPGTVMYIPGYGLAVAVDDGNFVQDDIEKHGVRVPAAVNPAGKWIHIDLGYNSKNQLNERYHNNTQLVKENAMVYLLGTIEELPPRSGPRANAEWVRKALFKFLEPKAAVSHNQGAAGASAGAVSLPERGQDADRQFFASILGERYASVAHLWEEPVFRFLIMGVLPMLFGGIGWAALASVVTFAAAHVGVKRFRQRGIAGAAKDFARYLVPSALFSAVYLAVVHVVPALPFDASHVSLGSHLAALACSMAVHRQYNRLALRRRLPWLPVASIDRRADSREAMAQAMKELFAKINPVRMKEIEQHLAERNLEFSEAAILLLVAQDFVPDDDMALVWLSKEGLFKPSETIPLMDVVYGHRHRQAGEADSLENYVHCLKEVLAFCREYDRNEDARAFVEYAAMLKAQDDLAHLQTTARKGILPGDAAVNGEYWDLASGTNFAQYLYGLNPRGRYRTFDTSPFVVKYLETIRDMAGIRNVAVVRQDVMTLQRPARPLGAVRLKNVSSYVQKIAGKLETMAEWIAPGGKLVLQNDPIPLQRKELLHTYASLARKLIAEGWVFEYAIASLGGAELDTLIFTRPGNGTHGPGGATWEQFVDGMHGKGPQAMTAAADERKVPVRKGGQWMFMQSFYERFGNGIVGQAVMPTLIESVFFVLGGSLLASFAFGLPVVLASPLLGVLGLFQLAWHVLHGSEKKGASKITISVLTIGAVLALYHFVDPAGMLSLLLLVPAVALPHLFVNSLLLEDAYEKLFRWMPMSLQQAVVAVAEGKIRRLSRDFTSREREGVKSGSLNRIMNRMAGHMSALMQTAHASLKADDAGHKALGENIAGYMIRLAENPGVSGSVAAEAVSFLSALVPVGEKSAVAYFARALQLPTELYPLVLERRGVGVEERVIELLRGVSGSEERVARYERMMYFILLRNSDDKNLLRAVIDDPSLHVRFRLYAFTCLGKQLRANDKEDERVFDEAANNLGALAPGFIKSGLDRRRFARLYNDGMLQDEEAKVYAAAVFLALRGEMPLRFGASVDILGRIAGTKIRSYLKNSYASFVLGNRYEGADNPEQLFFQTIAHEVGHNILLHTIRRKIYFSRKRMRMLMMLNEAFADMCALAFTGIVYNSQDAVTNYAAFAKYRERYEDALEDDLAIRESHKGARAFIATIFGANYELNERRARPLPIDWKAMLQVSQAILARWDLGKSPLLDMLVGYMRAKGADVPASVIRKVRALRADVTHIPAIPTVKDILGGASARGRAAGDRYGDDTPAAIGAGVTDARYGRDSRQYRAHVLAGAPLVEELVFRFVSLGVLGNVTLQTLAAGDPLGLGTVLGLSIGLFSAAHVVVKWLQDRNKPKEARTYPAFAGAVKDFARYLVPSLLFTGVYLAVASLFPVVPLAHFAAAAASVAAHAGYNYAVLNSSLSSRLPLASVGQYGIFNMYGGGVSGRPYGPAQDPVAYLLTKALRNAYVGADEHRREDVQLIEGELQQNRFDEVAIELLRQRTLTLDDATAIGRVLQAHPSMGQEQWNALEHILAFSRAAEAGEFIRLAAEVRARNELSSIVRSRQLIPGNELPEGEYWNLASNFAPYMHNLNPAVAYKVFDISPFVVQYLRKVAELLGLQNVQVIQADVMTLARPDVPLSVIRARNVTTYADAAPAGAGQFADKLREMAEWLTDGGRIIIQNDPVQGQRDEVIAKYRVLAQELLHQGWRFDFQLAAGNAGLDTLVFVKSASGNSSRQWRDYVTAAGNRRADEKAHGEKEDRDAAVGRRLHGRTEAAIGAKAVEAHFGDDSPQYRAYVRGIAPVVEELVFRFGALGAVGGATLQALAAGDPLALGSALGLSIGLFSSAHVVAKWLQDRSRPKEERTYRTFAGAAKDFARYLVPALLFTGVYLAVASFFPIASCAHVAATAASMVVHGVYNYAATGNSLTARFRPASAGQDKEVDEGSRSFNNAAVDLRIDRENKNLAEVMTEVLESMLNDPDVDDNIKKEIGERPLVAVTGSLSYARTQKGGKTVPDWDVIEDLDIKVYTRERIPVRTWEEIMIRYYDALAANNFKIHAPAYNAVRSPSVFFRANAINCWGIVNPAGKVFRVHALFYPKESLANMENEISAYNLTDLFFGTGAVAQLQRLRTVLGREGLARRLSNNYSSRIKTIREEYESAARDGMVTPKVLKRLYQLAFTVGRQRDFAWLLQSYRALERMAQDGILIDPGHRKQLDADYRKAYDALNIKDDELVQIMRRRISETESGERFSQQAGSAAAGPTAGRMDVLPDKQLLRLADKAARVPVAMRQRVVRWSCEVFNFLFGSRELERFLEKNAGSLRAGECRIFLGSEKEHMRGAAKGTLGVTLINESERRAFAGELQKVGREYVPQGDAKDGELLQVWGRVSRGENGAETVMLYLEPLLHNEAMKDGPEAAATRNELLASGAFAVLRDLYGYDGVKGNRRAVKRWNLEYPGVVVTDAELFNRAAGKETVRHFDDRGTVFVVRGKKTELRGWAAAEADVVTDGIDAADAHRVKALCENARRNKKAQREARAYGLIAGVDAGLAHRIGAERLAEIVKMTGGRVRITGPVTDSKTAEVIEYLQNEGIEVLGEYRVGVIDGAGRKIVALLQGNARNGLSGVEIDLRGLENQAPAQIAELLASIRRPCPDAFVTVLLPAGMQGYGRDVCARLGMKVVKEEVINGRDRGREIRGEEGENVKIRFAEGGEATAITRIDAETVEVAIEDLRRAEKGLFGHADNSLPELFRMIAAIKAMMENNSFAAYNAAMRYEERDIPRKEIADRFIALIETNGLVAAVAAGKPGATTGEAAAGERLMDGVAGLLANDAALRESAAGIELAKLLSERQRGEAESGQKAAARLTMFMAGIAERILEREYYAARGKAAVEAGGRVKGIGKWLLRARFAAEDAANAADTDALLQQAGRHVASGSWDEAGRTLRKISGGIGAMSNRQFFKYVVLAGMYHYNAGGAGKTIDAADALLGSAAADKWAAVDMSRVTADEQLSCYVALRWMAKLAGSEDYYRRAGRVCSEEELLRKADGTNCEAYALFLQLAMIDGSAGKTVKGAARASLSALEARQDPEALAARILLFDVLNTREKLGVADEMKNLFAPENINGILHMMGAA